VKAVLRRSDTPVRDTSGNWCAGEARVAQAPDSALNGQPGRGEQHGRSLGTRRRSAAYAALGGRRSRVRFAEFRPGGQARGCFSTVSVTSAPGCFTRLDEMPAISALILLDRDRPGRLEVTSGQSGDRSAEVAGLLRSCLDLADRPALAQAGASAGSRVDRCDDHAAAGQALTCRRRRCVCRHAWLV